MSVDVELECATGLVDRVKTNILDQATELRQQVIEIKDVYDYCVALNNDAESYACLREFALHFIEEFEGTFAQIGARRENVTLYALERLLDYHECRLEQTDADTAVASPRDARETYCALQVIENFNYRFASWIDGTASHYHRLTYRFIQCRYGPEDRQPRCFLELAEEARATLESGILFLADNRQYLIDSVDHLLNAYHVCRLA